MARTAVRSTGDWVAAAVPVGTVLDFTGPVPPAGFLFPYGQNESRSTYNELFEALTAVRAGNILTGSVDVYSIDTEDLQVGMYVESSGIPSGTTIATIGPTHISLSHGATIATIGPTHISLSHGATSTSNAAPLRFFLHGVGDGSTTFALPDCRGRVNAGRDNMGGTSANRLTTGGSGVDGKTVGGGGGAQNVALTEGELAAHSHGAGSLATTVGLSGSAPSLTGTTTFPNASHTHSTPNHIHATGYKNSDYTWDAFNSGGGLMRVLNRYNSWGTGGTAGADIHGANGNTYTYTNNSGSGTSGAADGTNTASVGISGGSYSLTGSNSVTGTSGDKGSGNAHNNVQPTFVVNKIIKT